MAQPLERKLAAILYADVAGYSRLTGEDEEGTHRALSAHLDGITAAIQRHNGKVMHFAGDAVLADFATASDALLCAAAVQRELEERTEDLPDERKIRFRIGVNLGEVIVDRGEIYGDGVNIAARLESLAEPGGICVSGTVYDAIGNKLPLDFTFLGEQSVKNIDKPVRAYAARLRSGADLPEPSTRAKTRRTDRRALAATVAGLLVIGIGMLAWWQPWQAREEPATDRPTDVTLPDKPSIAVLPFDNYSGDEEQEYFADGMTEDLITDLSKVSGLFVIARSSSFVYKGREVDVREAARELGVRYVLEGSVRKAGDRVRINAQLIDATTGGHMWAERYDRQLTDVFALQNEVIEQIVTALAVRLTPQESERVTRRSTTDVAAYDHFLRGQALARTANYEQAREFYQKAIDTDPGFARAYGAMSVSYALTGVQYGWSTEPQSAMDRALSLAKKAASIDDDIPQVQFALSLAYLIHRRFDEAVEASRRAIELDPGYADAYGLLAWIYSHAGNPTEGLRVLHKSEPLNPHQSAGMLGVWGLAHFQADHLEKAIEAFEAGRDSNPELMASRIYLTAAYVRSGRQDDAEWEATEILTLNPDFSAERWIKTQPYKNSAQLDRLRDDLRRAGLPE